MAESLIESGGLGKPDPWHLLRRWRKNTPICTINLSQSVRLALGAWMAGVPIRGGISDNHLNLLYTHSFKYRDLPIHLAQRYQPLLDQLTGQHHLQWLRLGRHNLGGARGLDVLKAEGWNGEPYITLSFGTRGYVKRWFPENRTWPDLANRLSKEGFRCVWLGGPDELVLGKELASLAPGSLDLTGKTSLPEACAIQEEAAGNVAIDTGLAHTAAATGRPTLTLMGHSPEPLIAPVGPRAITIRGSAVDSYAGESEGFDTHNSVAHRIHPHRVVALLTALMTEDPE
ncbi:glycosyltransferase family 9 protein [Geothrix sp. 21YS21S-4]|uniref:glycosyltransferase family 9 protein n=1 Tax=Geothrix sp. 21YS21S-4 TaxID=3068889 RepID=UPI0027BA17B4|nr:glycosyltransferase family 9 protein [Geothrix sp. 21YS21S-4]